MSEQSKLQDQSSMDHWWPRLGPLDVPTPDTVRLPVVETREFQDGLAMPVPGQSELQNAVSSVGGPPAFLRSDVTSRKHEMGDSRIETADPSEDVVAGIVEQHHLAMGMPMPDTWYVREWLDLYHEFKGWDYDHRDFPTPVAAEIRFFIHKGEIYDSGFYWPKDSITRPDRDNWESCWEKTRTAALNTDQDTLKDHACTVAGEFDTGYWSVDFALTNSGQWYAIDMARGELSWHPDDIEQAVDDPRRISE